MRSCGGPSDVEQRVATTLRPRRASVSCSSVLWSTWFVSAYWIRLSNASTIAAGDRLEAVLEVERRERRLEHRREHVAVAREPRSSLARRAPVAAGEQPLAEPELARDDGAARARDDVRAELRHLPLVEVREAVVERVGDRELEHGVAEELEPLVRLAALGGPARMGEDRGRALGRQRRDQLARESSVPTGAR